MPQRKKFGPLPSLTASLLAASAFALFSTTALAQACPLEGDAKQALAKQLNPLKNREDAPTPDRVDRAATLGAVLAPGPDLNRWNPANGAVFEGVVINVKIGGIESVNCHAKDPPHRDTHIELGLDASASPRQRVIVEVTPRWRTKMQAEGVDWSTSALHKMLIGHRVRVTGWLFGDFEHRPQAENSNPGGPSNWRATVWEIHPITGIEVLSGSAVNASATAPITHAATRHRLKVRRKCVRSAHRTCRRTVHKRTGSTK